MCRDPPQVVIGREEAHHAVGHHVTDVGDDAASFIHLKRGRRTSVRSQSRPSNDVVGKLRQSPCVESLCSGRWSPVPVQTGRCTRRGGGCSRGESRDLEFYRCVNSRYGSNVWLCFPSDINSFSHRCYIWASAWPISPLVKVPQSNDIISNATVWIMQTIALETILTGSHKMSSICIFFVCFESHFNKVLNIVRFHFQYFWKKGIHLSIHLFSIRFVIKTHRSAAAPAPLAHSRTQCGRTSWYVCPLLLYQICEFVLFFFF